jgi:bifunctional non-homologous end joining protein LigD
MEQIAKSPDRVWSSKREPEEPDLGRIEGDKQAPFPDEVEPQLATLATVAPEGDEWCHEIKFDGYRILAHIHDGQVSLHSRRGLDWSARFGAVAKDLAALPVRSAVLDGEMVVLDQHGVSDFQALQNSLQSGPRAPGGLTYYAFDLLYLDGWDLRGARLDARKEALRSIFAGRATAVSAVRFSDHVVGQGGAYRDEACKLGLEGIVCKRRDAIYRGGRSTSWLKVKCAARQEFVIGGFSDPGGSRELFGALLLGVYENGQLRYAGKSGSGFSESSLRQIYGKLKALEQADPPFVNPPTGADAKGVHWIRPEVVAEIAFAGFTDDGRARQAIFHGLREDKSASEVSRERARDPESIEVRNAGRRKDGATAAMALTHPDRILYPEQGLTKRALAEYYQQVAPFMIPHVANRPLTLLRCPEGQGSTCFFQKHSHVGLVRGLSPVQIKENGGEGTYLVLHDLEGLVALVQMGVLEIHVWGARADLPDAPDRLVFDLDPDEDVGWPAVVAAAKEVRDRFSAIGLVSFVKTTGGKGLHVVVPVRRDSKQFDWDKAKSFCKAMAQSMEKDSPTRYLSIATKAKRKGKIYVDYLRNGRGATAIAPYSSRAKAGATVSAPLAWEELDTLASSSAYTVQSMARRLVDLPGDPWSDLPSIDQMLDRKLLSKL